MKTSFKYILSAIIATATGIAAFAQAPNSLYFLDGITQRHYLNPALACECGWVETPLNISVGANSNLGLGAFMQPYNDEMITFLHPSISTNEALSKFDDNNAIETNFDYALLNVGFKAFGGVNSIGVSIHNRVGAYIPKDVFTFLKAGQEYDITEYNISDFNIIAKNYAEIALGHSRKINDRLSVGAKVKLLLGAGYANANIEDMRIYMSGKKWMIHQNSSFTSSKSLELITKNNGEIDDFDYTFGLDGFGLGLDLGATYKIQDNLNVSFAITDIGFINWNNASVHRNIEDSFEYTGFDNIADENSQNFDDAADDIIDRLEELTRYEKDATTTSASSSLHTTFRAGVEYSIINNKMSFGFLGTTRIGTPKTYTEGMLSVNFKPFKYFKATINGSVSNTHNSLGGVIALGNFFIGADYILAKYSKQFIPIDAAKFNLAFGTSIKF